MRAAYATVRDFVNENYQFVLIALFGVISFAMMTEQGFMPGGSKIFFPWIIVIALVTKDRSLKAMMLLLATILLGWAVFNDWYRVANHSFVITFIGFALFLMVAAEKEEGEASMRFIARFFLTLLMGLALVQKLLSPYYMSGNLMTDYLLNEPQIFSNLLEVFFPGHHESLHDINLIEREFRAAPPSLTPSADITFQPVILPLALLLTYVSLFWQAFLELCLWLKNWLGIWLHRVIILFVIIIYSTVNENEFLSMNLFFGFAMTDESTKRARMWYVVLAFFLLTIKLVGLRPNLIN